MLLITLFRGAPRAHAPQSTKSRDTSLHQRPRARADRGDVTLSRQAVRSSESGPFSAVPAGLVTDHGELCRAGHAVCAIRAFTPASTEISVA